MIIFVNIGNVILDITVIVIIVEIEIFSISDGLY